MSSAYSVANNTVFTDAFLTKEVLIDEVDFFQFNQHSVEYEVFSMETAKKDSMYNVWPTKEK